jgi:hypothetical protein
VFTASFIHLSLYQTFNGYCGELSVENYIAFALFRLRGNYLQETVYSFQKALWLTVCRKSSRFLVEILELVSSASIMDTDEAFSVGGRLFL